MPTILLISPVMGGMGGRSADHPGEVRAATVRRGPAAIDDLHPARVNHRQLWGAIRGRNRHFVGDSVGDERAIVLPES
ncbi:MAG: hypothetical protein ACLP51_20200 [Syntrophobacteraceae bacterium]